MQNPDSPMSSITRLNKDVLRTLCDERNIPYPGKSQKLDLIERLFAVVSHEPCEPFRMPDWPISLTGPSSALLVFGRRGA